MTQASSVLLKKMGYAYDNADGPKMCFNGAKNWQLGWFGDKQIELDETTSYNWMGNIDGIVDYSPGSDAIIVRVVKGTETFFITYNKATGINEGSQIGSNNVLVHRLKKDVHAPQSELLAKLKPGDIFVVSNTPVEFVEIFNNAHAVVKIGDGSPAPNTLSPTKSPTTLSPTQSPIDCPEDNDSKSFFFKYDNSLPIIKTCMWLKDMGPGWKTNICKHQTRYYKESGQTYKPAQIACTHTCGTNCDPCFENEKTMYSHNKKQGGRVILRTCQSLSRKKEKNIKKICEREKSYKGYPIPFEACPVTCKRKNCKAT